MKLAASILCAWQIVAAGFPLIDANITQSVEKIFEDFGLIPISSNDVTFRLWTQQLNMSLPLYYGHLCDEISIRPNNTFKIIIHGWIDNASTEWYDCVKDEYLKKGDYNVIQVDWSKPAAALYPAAAHYSQSVGKYVAEFIMDLNSTLGVPYEIIHVIGHSLGAHVAGFAGKIIFNTTRLNIGRITGMDPAAPLFWPADPTSRLSNNDANFVDIIHTAGGIVGYYDSLGDLDFYPNGGSLPQPGCSWYQKHENILDVRT